MSRKHKNKYQPLQSKKKKGKQGLSLAVSQQQTVPGIKDVEAVESGLKLEAAVVRTPAMVRTPEIIAELRRIGILALVILATLILLTLMLG